MPWCAWLKHYPKDFALETGHLKPEELGAYVRLRDQYFANNGTLPDDDIVLARIARISDEQWPSVRVMLLTLFKIEDGVWIHPRLDITLSVSQESYEKFSANGKKGAQARLKRGSSEASARPKQSDSEPEAESESSIEDAPYSPPAGDGYSVDFEKFWEAYPSKVGKDAAFRAFKSVIKKGVTLEILLDGVARYIRSKPADREWCNPNKWLREGRWKDEVPTPEPSDRSKPDSDRDWETRLSIYKPGGYWHADWGPRPEEDGCKVPVDLIDGWLDQHRRSSTSDPGLG